MRVVSLVPSVTETLLAWGIVPVACTRFCEQPDLVHVGGTKDPDVAAIVALAPDVVVVNDEENRREDVDAMLAAGLTVHITSVRSVDEVAPMLAALARAVSGPAVSAEPLPPARPRDRVAFVPIWRRPWMTLNAATYGASVLDRLGVGDVFADAPERYPTVTLAEAAARRPDLVLLPSEPYPFAERHLPEVRAAFPGADIRLIDGRDLFWWGVRTPAALARLADALGPTTRSGEPVG